MAVPELNQARSVYSPYTSITEPSVGMKPSSSWACDYLALIRPTWTGT